MTALSRHVRSRWVLSLIGVALLSVLVWLFGPFLTALEGAGARAAVIAALLVLWAGANAALTVLRRRRDAALVEGVAGTEPASAAASDAPAEEVAAMGERLSSALSLLRKASGRRGYLYEQPWYVIIGPPGAGKTTALLNAGLRFPLADEMGQRPVAGVGGTRMCDWWFTDQAVLIDTAGRYTTQDSDAAVDKAGWAAFLGLLKRTRSRQPLNGVIVAISVAEIAAASPAQRVAHAKAIRRRIKEIDERLGIRVPVYALFTKADLLAGFTEFFDDLDRDQRGQVWGMTFPLERQGAAVTAAFGPEFALLTERLNARLIDRLQAERSPERRALLAGFPSQFASLQGPLAEFLRETFEGSRLDPGPFLRGVYFTSGTQEGTPIDRLAGALARTFGIDQHQIRALRPEQGRSYFLSRLLNEVVFGEAMLVARDPSAVRRGVILKGAAFGLAGLVLLVGVGALWQTRRANAAAVQQANQALADYAHHAQPFDRPVSDADFASILPVLDEARALPFGTEGGNVSGGWFPGLSQIGKLRAGGEAAYQRALDNILLPRLVWRVEQQMRANLGNPDFLYDATRVYLMLGGDAPVRDRASIQAWMHYDWLNTYPGPAQQDVRERLERHLGAMLDNPLPKIQLDGRLVDAARVVIARVPLADRVYAAIRRSAPAQAVPDWSPATAAGPAGAQLFVRASGKPMTEGIPGFYTYAGFQTVLLPLLPGAAGQVAAESWVAGQQSSAAPTSEQTNGLEQDVISLYAAEFERRWDSLLGDLKLAPMQNIDQARRNLYLLSSPRSPMKDLLSGVVRQVDLTAAPTPAPAPAKTVAAAAPALTSVAPRVQSLLAPAQAAQPPGAAIAAHYSSLIAFVGDGKGPAPIDAVLKLLNDLQVQLSQFAAPPGAAPPAATAVGADPATLLRAEASRDPLPVAAWLNQLAVSADQLRTGGERAQTQAAFNAPGGPGPLCREAIEGRYPFSPGSSRDVPLGDFAHLFAPGGLLDSYFNAQVRPFVDTSGRVWRVQAVQGVAPPISSSALLQFQLAEKISDAFFGSGGGAQPFVRLEVTPVSLSGGATGVTLDLGEQSLSYNKGPGRPTGIVWPGGGIARVTFTPDSGPLETTGPWALFRLLQGRLSEEGSPDRYRLTIASGGNEAVFEIRAASLVNPLVPGLLRSFRCPQP